MKPLLFFLFTITSSLAYCQAYIIEYEERRTVDMPDTTNPFVLEKMKEIIKDKENTIYLNRTSKTNNGYYSTIDSMYYDKNYNDAGISTTVNKIEYHTTSGASYIRDQRYDMLFELAIDDLDIKTHKEHRIINGYNCKKITATYLTAEYQLWVTEDKEARGGPMVFSLLPYLVVEAKSPKRHFTLRKIVKQETTKEDYSISDKKIKPIANYEKKIGK